MKYFFLFIFISLNFIFANDKSIYQRATNDSDIIFELLQQANSLESQKREICNKISKFVLDSRINLKKEEMEEYNEKFKLNLDKHIENLKDSENFDINICIGIEPKMKRYNTGPFEGPLRDKPAERQIEICVDKENKCENNTDD